MRAGRCITSEYGHAMGCYSDVTTYLDDTCSGRHNCSMLVATIDSVAQPCAKDFKSYLEVTYECVKGEKKLSIRVLYELYLLVYLFIFFYFCFVLSNKHIIR